MICHSYNVFHCVVVQTSIPVDMVKLDQQLELVIRSAWAESTLKTRNSRWKRYIDFCQSNNLTPVPGDIITVARFLIHLASSCKYTTCNNYLSSIVGLHKFFGADSSFRESFVIQLVMKGLGRRLGKNVSQKIGLSPRQMIDIHNKLDFSEVNDITKWTALVLAFRTLLRKSNIVQTTYKDDSMIVLRSDVTFSSSGLLIKVRKTKTLQASEYVLEIPVSYTDCNGLCAASMLAAHFARTQHIRDGPLFFVVSNKGDWKPLLYNDLLKFLKTIVPIIGLSPQDLGLHSMRRARAAYLQSLGISLVDIMSCGDWRSLAALSYLITPLERKKDIEALVSASLKEL